MRNRLIRCGVACAVLGILALAPGQAVAIRGTEIVRQLLVYAGQNEDTIEPVNVSRLIEESLDLLKVVVSKHAVLELRARFVHLSSFG